MKKIVIHLLLSIFFSVYYSSVTRDAEKFRPKVRLDRDEVVRRYRTICYVVNFQPNPYVRKIE